MDDEAVPEPVEEPGPVEETEPLKQQWIPLSCPNCSRSAYVIDFAAAARARSIQADMIRKTDERALDPQFGMTLACPYCADPLAVAQVFPVIGGGWEVRFKWLGMMSRTT